ncbi:recombinase [Bosea caraganae]|uniref:Recombinase n=1 Tax=Bosea caraganae TaxID=2763117 RepID=A0A370L142_9HYPH|nr:recombinase family protein [Bosea caraganae]RDJ21098.1 recombinase [Bosea caraganae]RDJ28597.1 recombinase [Bosea caraganae]
MPAKTEIPAIIYCRVSSAAQVKKGDGLASQETRCREYAALKGYVVAEVFRDEAVSGGMIDRPGMQAMLSFLKKHRRREEHVVIIDDISRLARGLEAHIRLRTEIGAAGGKLESPSIEFGDDSDSRLVENLLASVSQHQRQKNAEQVVNRMRARLMNGYWVFRAPIGYRYDRVAGHGKLLVRSEPNATAVQQAFEGFASGRFETLMEIKRFLETLPAFPRYRNGEVHIQHVKDMLCRPVYAGYLDAPEWRITLAQGKHEPLISFETWQKVQDRFKVGAKAPIRKDIHADFPLRGFVTCGCCEAPMTAAWSKGRSALYAYYFCNTKACPSFRKSIRKDRIEGDFEQVLQSLRPTQGLFFMARDMLRDLWEDRSRTGQQQLQAIRAELKTIERKTEQIMERILASDSHALITAYEDQVRKLHERNAALAEKEKTCGRPLANFDETFRTAFDFLANPWKLWLSGQIEDQRMVLRLAFAGRIAYLPNEGFRTADLALPFKALASLRDGKKDLVGRAGLEPAPALL